MQKSKLRASATLDPCLAGRILLKLDPADAAVFADVLRLAFNKDQPRDEGGRWTRGGSAAPRPAAKRAKSTLAEGPPPPKTSGAQGAHAQAAPPQVKNIDNPQYNDLSWFVKGAGKPPSVVEKEEGPIKPTIIPRGRDAAGKDQNTIGVHQGHTIVAKDVPDGFLVGAEGAGPCAIAVVSMPSSKRPGTYDVIASHFQAKDNPSAVWDKIGNFPSGTRVALAGGDGSDSSKTQMRATIDSLAHKKGVTIDGYFRGNGLWVDNKGKYYAYKTNIERK